MKKKVFASIMLGATLLVSSSVVFASSSDEATHGEVNLDETRDLIQIMKLTKTKAGGGTWYHGFEDDQVKSNYNHTKKTHKSSAQAGGERFFSSKWKKKDEGYTYASVYQTLWGNRAFWDTK
ncbi:lactococcin 972 family bacteriocin [Bacillus halotolerans]|uniref:Lactococcin 972 family bacteriocin n=1 Tax=Bacillus halotolerans TaxID=260554 RepID=A0A9Q4EKV6_9BACI|nr:lactococcin 972 family bacteriocin [Bacillus halotolerans]MCY9186119.1 lactococcin 972 family bacteriocin [Bacillus halotolerans]MCY9201324.1 lactococcin 972 family bacteriocin [Bacillus halotolerans]